MRALLATRSDLDWVGFAIVLGAVLLAVILDYGVTRVLLWLDGRATRATVRRVRAIAAARCAGCGCQVAADHEQDGVECRELQAERLARAEVRAREWSA